jgi:hypothetical protein
VARQLGPDVRVSFEVPVPRGPNPAQELASAELLRVAYPPGPVAAGDAEAFRRRGVLVARTPEGALASGASLSLIDPSGNRLAGGGIGWTLRYGVKLHDRKGRPSPLVVTHDLELLPSVPAPSTPAAQATSQGLALSWSPPAVEGEVRYNVYRSRPGEPWPETPLNGEPLSESSYLDGTAEVGERFLYQVRPSLAPGIPYREGEPSGTLEVVVEDRSAPSPPTSLVAVQEGPAVRLFWNPGRESDIAGYRLYRKIQGQDWVRVGPDSIESPSFLDVEIDTGQVLSYSVTALDGARPPNESDPSATVQIEIVPEPALENP